MRKYWKIIRPYKEYIISVTLLLFSIGIGIFLIRPGIIKILAVRENIQALEGEIEILNSKVAVLNSLSEANLIENLQELIIALPSDMSVATILTTMDQASLKAGVSISSYSLHGDGALGKSKGQKENKKSDLGGAEVAAFPLTVTGSFDNEIRFLSLLLNVRRLFRIADVTLSIKDDTSASLAITVEALYKMLPSSIGRIDSLLKPFTKEELAVLEKTTTLENLSGNFFKEYPPDIQADRKRDPFIP